MAKKKDRGSGLEEVAIKWAQEVAEHDYAAAHAYLSLKLTAKQARRAVARLRKAKLTSRRADDILRAAGLDAGAHRMPARQGEEVRRCPENSSAA